MSDEIIDRIHGLGESFKYALIDRCLPTESLLDAGGVWGVHGAYALHAALGGVPRVVMLDTLRTPELEEWRAKKPQVEFVHGDMNDPGVFASFEKVETSICFEVIFHQAAPQWTLHALTSCTTKRIVLSVSVLPESRFPNRNCAVFLPGLPKEEQEELHPEPSNPVFKIFSEDPADARSHSEWHWGLTSSLVKSWMTYLGWSVEHEESRPFRGAWDWWQAIFRPDPDARF